jgi:hypothetical protein
VTSDPIPAGSRSTPVELLSLDELLTRNIPLPPFEAIVRRAGAMNRW